MRDDLLKKAREQAEQADPPVRAAALVRIARAESPGNASEARQTLLEGLDAVKKLTGEAREYLLDEARVVAAAVSPEMVAEIPAGKREIPGEFASVQIIQTMLTHGHVDAAFDYVIREDDPESFPFRSVGGVLHKLDADKPECAARRLTLLRHAVEIWRKGSSSNPRPMRRHFAGRHDGFISLFGYFWKDFPAEEALSIARTLVERAAEEPDTGISAGYPDGISFSSPRQNSMFQILHVLRHLDPALAQSLIDSYDQLAAAVRRYPNGIETMNEEVEAETKRREAERATCKDGTCGTGGGYFLAGDPKDFDRQRRLIDAVRNGEFETVIEDALEKYGEDTTPESRNYAPKEYWPSTGAFRTMFHQAGKRLGLEAAGLLERIPDDDLRLFATIELAAALAGAPASSITTMKRPHPPDSRAPRGRIISARSGTGIDRTERHGPAMRSPEGRLIHCPKCRFQPTDDVRWICKCGHVWNTFWTAGKCPACHFQWEETGCPRCGEMSEHRTWYESQP